MYFCGSYEKIIVCYSANIYVGGSFFALCTESAAGCRNQNRLGCQRHKGVNVDGRYGQPDTVEIDTVVINYQDNNPVNNFSIANSWNGNLGSPLESKIFFDRRYDTYENMFARAYAPYTILPEDVRFYNTKAIFTVGVPVGFSDEQGGGLSESALYA